MAAAVTAVVVEILESVDPVPVAGKTAVMAPATAEVKLVAATTTAAAVAVVAPPGAAEAEMTIPVTEVLRADALKGRRRAIAGRPLPGP